MGIVLLLCALGRTPIWTGVRVASTSLLLPSIAAPRACSLASDVLVALACAHAEAYRSNNQFIVHCTSLVRAYEPNFVQPCRGWCTGTLNPSICVRMSHGVVATQMRTAGGSVNMLPPPKERARRFEAARIESDTNPNDTPARDDNIHRPLRSSGLRRKHSRLANSQLEPS
jgi:hypothetical protein